MISIFHILHVFSIICLVGTICAAAAAPIPSRRKKSLMWSGIASLGVLITGFGLAGILKYGFPIWLVVKIICWLAISGMVGMFFKKPQDSQRLLVLSLAIVVIALIMVYVVR